MFDHGSKEGKMSFEEVEPGKHCVLGECQNQVCHM